MQIFLITWFLLTGLSVAFVTYDLMTNTPDSLVKERKKTANGKS